MRKIYLLLVGLMAMLFLSACHDSSSTATNNSTDAVPTTDKIVIGLDDNFPPMGFRDENDELVGFDIELSREAAKRAGLTVEFKPIDWSAKESELKSKRVDVLWNGLTIIPERKKNILFSKPYMVNHQIIVVRPDANIKLKSDLKGKIVGVQDGSSAVYALTEDSITPSFKELKKYGDNITALMDLSNKRVDALVVDEMVGRYYVSKKPNDYVVLKDDFGSEDYGVGFRQDDQELQQKIQKALDSMKADGTSAKIAEKWFGSNTIK